MDSEGGSANYNLSGTASIYTRLKVETGIFLFSSEKALSQRTVDKVC